ncbi:MAG: DNA-binding CsgD family transcriptional regulator [Phenylobacterium sp.]|jgi:DNA-binding CsgD family transcriptional regulator
MNAAPRVTTNKALTISNAISQIYHYTQGGSLTEFKQNALAQLAKVIDFDSACWIILTGDNPQPDNVFLSALPPHLEPTYDHHLLSKLQNSPQQMVTRTTDNNIHNTQHIVILNRTASNSAFDQHDINSASFVVDNLKQAFHLYLQAQLKRHWICRHSHKAICDKNGLIIEAEAGFFDILAQQLSGWDHRHLPPEFNPHKPSAKLEYGNIKVQITLDNGVYVAEAYEFDPCIESLTKAEKIVAKHLLLGATNKEIAQAQELSPKTIEHQVKSLCNKLDVTGKTEATWRLQKSNYCF